MFITYKINTNNCNIFFDRTSYELEVVLNHNPNGDPWNIGEIQTLQRLKLAIRSKQKAFVAHSSIQQLLAALWYEGVPGFRRKSTFSQELIQLAFRLMQKVWQNSTVYLYYRSFFYSFIVMNEYLAKLSEEH